MNGEYLVGASAPGLNYIPVGRKAGLAWGTTAGSGDISDLYVERVDDK